MSILLVNNIIVICLIIFFLQNPSDWFHGKTVTKRIIWELYNNSKCICRNIVDKTGGCVVKGSARGLKGRRFDTRVHQLSD